MWDTDDSGGVPPEFERRFGVSAKDVYPGLMEMFVEEKAAVFQGDRFVLTGLWT